MTGRGPNVSRGAGIALLCFGLLLIIVGASISPTRTVESCYEGAYSSSCVETTVPNPFPRSLVMFAGFLATIGGFVAVVSGTASTGDDRSSTGDPGVEPAADSLADTLEQHQRESE